MSPVLSIVSPVYRAGPIVAPLVERILAAVEPLQIPFEIVLVKDAGPDDSWARIRAIAEHEPRLHAVRLSRNFGQHAAITAGLAHARGEFVVVMDCDLQDDPAYIPALLAQARAGFDIVLTRKAARRHAWHRNVGARLFARLLNALSPHHPADPEIGGYSLLTRRVVNAFLRIEDAHRHYLLLLGWLGFRTTTVPVEHHPRHSGSSSYTFRRLARHALEGITSQSTTLLKIAIGVGFGYGCAAAAGLVYLIVGYTTHGFLAGWASTMVLLLASTSLILMAVGVLGIYLGNVFDQVRRRPIYVVQEEINLPPSPP